MGKVDCLLHRAIMLAVRVPNTNRQPDGQDRRRSPRPLSPRCNCRDYQAVSTCLRSGHKLLKTRRLTKHHHHIKTIFKTGTVITNSNNLLGASRVILTLSFPVYLVKCLRVTSDESSDMGGYGSSRENYGVVQLIHNHISNGYVNT